jgi:hypothetical protein
MHKDFLLVSFFPILCYNTFSKIIKIIHYSHGKRQSRSKERNQETKERQKEVAIAASF